jgi:hypothetical protein
VPPSTLFQLYRGGQSKLENCKDIENDALLSRSCKMMAWLVYGDHAKLKPKYGTYFSGKNGTNSSVIGGN